MYLAVHWTALARMLVSVGLANDIVNAIVDKQGYNTPHALSHLHKKDIEMLVCHLQAQRDEEWNQEYQH